MTPLIMSESEPPNLLYGHCHRSPVMHLLAD